MHILFDDNDKIIHRVSDISAVISDKVPHDVGIGHHVVATWKGGNKYFIGYMSDDNDEDYYAVSHVRDSHEPCTHMIAKGYLLALPHKYPI